LYVTGRVKDIIIRAGHNVHPDELEESVGRIDGVRDGCVAVFAVPDPNTGTERLVVMAETRQSDEAARDALPAQIIEAMVDLLGTAPDDIVLTPPHTVPKTSSGKIRRAAGREAYQRGTIGHRPIPLWRQLALLGWNKTMYDLRRTRRTGAAIAFAAYGWLLFIALAVPLLAMLVLVPGQQRRRRSVRAGAQLLARLTDTPITAQGLDQLPAGSWVAVANHASMLDGFVLAATLPETCHFIIAEIFARRATIRFILGRLGTHFVERTEREQGIRDTKRLSGLAIKGQQLVMFPEGGLGHTAELRPFHMGAFVTAARAGVPVVPIIIQGTQTILTPGRRFPRHGAVHITVDAPLQPTGTDWATAVQLQHAARASILRHCGEPDLQ
jgi:1-acyl-sn-glycerol-3-phosphate acyltransferase